MFGAGDDAEELADAPERICKLIAEVRIPAEKLITSGQEHLVKLRNQEREFEAAQDAGGTVYQKQWDKLDKEITRWSGPVKVGKFGLMLVKSVLDEAYVLAEWGPRATQQALGKCLSELKPLELGLAQQRLEEVIERTKVYWR